MRESRIRKLRDSYLQESGTSSRPDVSAITLQERGESRGGRLGFQDWDEHGMQQIARANKY
jgi:hypothetical protein